jgi:mRNA interferase MazF
MAATPSRGEVWWASFGSVAAAEGDEQAKERPVLVVSADFVNRSSADMCTVLPLTTSTHRVRSHVTVVPPEGGVAEPSAIQCEQIRAISRRRLTRIMGTADRETMDEVEHALRMVLELR